MTGLRSRASDNPDEFVLQAKGRKLSVGVTQSCNDIGPLTWADLEREVVYLTDAGLEMTLLVPPAAAPAA